MTNKSVLGQRRRRKEETVRKYLIRVFVILTPLQALLNEIKGKR